jgi:hypothetical protein
MVSGELFREGKSAEITSGRLLGSDLIFSVDGVNYKCRVERDIMKGTAEKNGKITEWKAEKLK